MPKLKAFLWRALRWPFALTLALRDWWAVAKVLAGSRGFRNAWCRSAGHPNGTIYYRTGGDPSNGPDGRCKDCGEDIG